LNGAEPVNHKTVLDFHKAFGPLGFDERTMYPVYGLAEATVAVAFPRPGEPMRTQSVDRAALADGYVVTAQGDGATTLTSVGTAIPGHEIVVADEDGATLSDRQVGHIVVRGPSVMKGYFQDPEATHGVLRDGWLWTGDLGFTDKGDLYVTGRAKDLIIVRGKNYYAEDVERVAETVDGVRHGGVVAFAVYDEGEARDEVIVVCETKKTQEDRQEQALAEEISETVSRVCGVRVDEVVLVEPGTIPKTSSGKRQRSLTRQHYLKSTLAPVRTGSLGLVRVFARSAAGLLAMLGRSAAGTRREPP
jgi:fatty-acyl-CoA synthase